MPYGQTVVSGDGGPQAEGTHCGGCRADRPVSLLQACRRHALCQRTLPIAPSARSRRAGRRAHCLLADESCLVGQNTEDLSSSTATVSRGEREGRSVSGGQELTLCQWPIYNPDLTNVAMEDDIDRARIFMSSDEPG